MSILAKVTRKHPEKHKKSNQLKTEKILNINISVKSGAVFAFSLPGGRLPLRPRQLGHCSLEVQCNPMFFDIRFGSMFL